MPTVLQDGTGSGFDVKVDIANRLFVTGSITSMPAISAAADPATTKIGAAGLGSASLAGAYDGVGDVQALRIVNGSHLLIAGSISSMPPVSVTAGSQSYLLASGPSFYELIATPENALITSLSGAMGSVGVTALPGILGSVYIKSNKIGVSGTLFQDILGSVRISAPVLEVSGGIFTGGDLTGSFAQKGIGSIVIKSAPLIGVSGAIFDSGDITGSMVISSSTRLGVSGNVIVNATNLDIRDLTSASDSVEITGTSEIGSVVISSASLIGVSGLKLDDLGGSFAIVNEMTMQDVGSPNFKTSYLIASGAWSQTWSIGGAGSKLEIYGWHISTTLPGQVRILISGASNNAYDSGLIANYFINFISGGIIEKTFVSPIIPAGAGSAIGFGTSSAGSTNVTIYGREVK